MKVSQKFQVKEVVGAFVGLELEVEGGNLPVQHDFPSGAAVWEVKRDGSLRNGLEYVFAGPRGAIKTREALEEMETVMRNCHTTTDYSFRTSTHVHVNVSNLELDVVKAMVAMFYMFEDEYIDFCARSRKSNRFCLGMKDADGVVTIMRRFFQRNEIPAENDGKYSALNLCTLNRFGTLELRCLEGTNDWARIYTWVRALLALRKAAKELGTLTAVMDTPIEDLARLMFPTERLRGQFLKDGWQARVGLNQSVGWDAFHIGVN